MRLYDIAAGFGLSGLVASAASAALIPTLASRTPDAGATRFSYDVVLAPDQGVSTSAPNPSTGTPIGTQFVIFDFAGYVDGSIFSSNPLFTATAELLSPGLPELVGATDDPTLVNLRFTYNGPPVNTRGGPFTSVSEGTFGAVSTLPGLVVSDFSSVAVKNSGMDGAVGSAAFNQGSVAVPAPVGSVPEAASWAMMAGGFGLLGGALRRRRSPAAFA